jgi:protein-S-isoprenylcysteine O-methyltransferase Ste14
VNPSALDWSSLPLPGFLRALGVILWGSGGLLLIWTLRALGPNLTDTVVTRRNHTLVMHGPYRWVRHPFYVATALLMAGVFLIAANALFLALGAGTLALLFRRTRTEEELLRERFGNAYGVYARRTGRFFPRWP